MILRAIRFLVSCSVSIELCHRGEQVFFVGWLAPGELLLTYSQPFRWNVACATLSCPVGNAPIHNGVAARKVPPTHEDGRGKSVLGSLHNNYIPFSNKLPSKVTRGYSKTMPAPNFRSTGATAPSSLPAACLYLTFDRRELRHPPLFRPP